MVKVHWGIFAKYDIDPDVFYFADTVHTIFAEPDQIGKEFQIEFVFFLYRRRGEADKFKLENLGFRA